MSHHARALEMTAPCELLVVLPSVGGGGAERAALDLLRSLDRNQFHITLALFTKEGRFLPQIPSDIPVVDLQGRQSYDVRLIWRLARLIRERQPQVVFSVLRYANLITLLACRLSGSPARVVVNEQNLPSAEFVLFGGGAVKASALRWLYPRAARVTCIAQGIARELVKRYGIPEKRVQVLPNPVDLERVRSLGQVAPDHPWFQLQQPVVVAVGRLHRQKGFDVLIHAFARVRRSVPCKLLILGEGSLHQELEQLIAREGLGEDAQLVGFQENPYSYMAHATTFVLSSRYEGFGNVLVEALALGTAVVSTRCPVGPEEILEADQTGILVPPEDEAALARGILRVLQEPELRATLSSNGPPRAEVYSLQRITARYQTLFSELRGTICAS